MPGTLDISPQTIQILRELREKHPETPFLTLGQTVLWDEPVKAALCRCFEILVQNGQIPSRPHFFAGVHDTDYFAKLEGVSVRDEPFVVLRHNDGDTRGLWSAAGELSALFGAEIVTARHELARDGASFGKASRVYSGGAETLLNQETDAPLWRAVVHTAHEPLIAADVKLREILPALRQQLRWGFRQSLSATGCPPDFENDEPCPSRDVARKILGWVDEFAAQYPQSTLSELYKSLIPKIWELVRGAPSCDLFTTSSVELFRFNAQTASRPRFHFVDLFLNPATREVCKRAYNDAVRNSGIYTLDGFGDGALPFDVVVPGRGRGTLRLHDARVVVETEPPVEICNSCEIESVAQLAALLQNHFGENVALVGKAVSLISMLSAEFLFVFHEKASGYTARTAHMNAQIRAHGIPLKLHPLLRLKYRTWDCLANLAGTFELPEHLHDVFGVSQIAISDFAASWKNAVEHGDHTREKLRALRRPRDLMRFLAQTRGQVWREKEAAYVAARGALAMLRAQNAPLSHEIETLRREACEHSARVEELQREKGAFFRAQILPKKREIAALKAAIFERVAQTKITREERLEREAQTLSDQTKITALEAQIDVLGVEWKAFDSPIEAAKSGARELKKAAKFRLNQRLLRERGLQTQAAREAIERLENEAELERFLMARNARRGADALRLTNFRPTAWWLPMVSPDGKWFENIANSLSARLEEI